MDGIANRLDSMRFTGDVQASGSAPSDPLDMLRTRQYLALLLFGALIGVPVAAMAHGFLELTDVGQEWLHSDLPIDVGFSAVPVWWPLPVLAIPAPATSGPESNVPARAGDRAAG